MNPDETAVDTTSNGNHLRHRKSMKQGRRSTWKIAQLGAVTPAHESVFLTMQLRKLDRALTGTKSRNTSYEFIALAVMLVLIYSAGTLSRDKDSYDTDAFVSLSVYQVILIGVWLFVANLVTLVFRESKFIELLYWTLVYIPLLSIVAELAFVKKESGIHKRTMLLMIAEVLAVVIFFSIYYLYPHILSSAWFRRNGRVSFFFRLRLVSDWTMTYVRKRSRCGLGSRHTCKYSGQRNDNGEPHGLGRWFDDAFDGEVLTGSWLNGVPISPFVSRKYGNADTFRAVRVAYVKASDDTFIGTKWWPTNEKPMQSGMASVECSVSGSFYNHLPRAEDVFDPFPFDVTTSIQELINNLPYIHEQQSFQVLHIRADDPRGVQVENHVYSSSGKAVQEVDQIVVRVNTDKVLRRESQIKEFMPISTYFGGEERILVRNDTAADSDADDGKEKSISSHQNDSTYMDTTKHVLTDIHEVVDPEYGKERPTVPLSLTVDGWMPATVNEVLVFIPGFNCSLKEALENFGQLIAMTKLDSHVYPILFNWPCGQIWTYHSASRVSLSERNLANFCQFLKGLEHAGVRNVHLMSHSMGVQTLVGAMVDKEDGSRSDCSLCFQLAPDCDDTHRDEKTKENGLDKNLLVCRTVTLLNPDFPLVPFQEHAFRSVRRICKTVTVVGDKNDRALFFSQVVNGVAVRLGYRQPNRLSPNDANKKRLKELLTVGKCIDSLFFSEDTAIRNGVAFHDYLLFKEIAPMLLRSADEQIHEKLWMDLGK
jgi:hypothetical protein